MSKGSKVKPVRRINQALFQNERIVFVTLFFCALGVASWCWHGLFASGAPVLPAGSTDSLQAAWFFGFYAHALGTGSSPLFTNAISYPNGVNLLANASTPLLGVVLSPITATFGASAALATAVILAPSLSFLTAVVFLRRFVTSWFACVVGGFLFGFGPFLTTDLRYGHLNLTFLCLVPLIGWCLEDLFRTKRYSQRRIGIALGFLVVAQFFLSTEVLADIAIVLFVAGVFVFVFAPRQTFRVLAEAKVALGLGAGIAIVALAYPTWYSLRGPRHVHGAVWTTIGAITNSLGAALHSKQMPLLVGFVSGGDGAYLGYALVLVALVGIISAPWIKELQPFVLIGFIAYLFSLGSRLHVTSSPTHIALPWALVAHRAIFSSIVPERFMMAVDLCIAAVVAIFIDRIMTALRRAEVRTQLFGTAFIGIVVTVFILIPLAQNSPWPYRVMRTQVTNVFSQIASEHPHHAHVFVTYPATPTVASHAMLYQSYDHFSYSLVDDYAITPKPDGHGSASEPTNALFLTMAAIQLGRHVTLTGNRERAIRHDIRAEHVTEIVVWPRVHYRRVLSLFHALGLPIVQRDGVNVVQVRPPRTNHLSQR